MSSTRCHQHSVCCSPEKEEPKVLQNVPCPNIIWYSLPVKASLIEMASNNHWQRFWISWKVAMVWEWIPNTSCLGASLQPPIPAIRQHWTPHMVPWLVTWFFNIHMMALKWPIRFTVSLTFQNKMRACSGRGKKKCDCCWVRVTSLREGWQGSMWHHLSLGPKAVRPSPDVWNADINFHYPAAKGQRYTQWIFYQSN